MLWVDCMAQTHRQIVEWRPAQCWGVVSGADVFYMNAVHSVLDCCERVDTLVQFVEGARMSGWATFVSVSSFMVCIDASVRRVPLWLGFGFCCVQRGQYCDRLSLQQAPQWETCWHEP